MKYPMLITALLLANLAWAAGGKVRRSTKRGVCFNKLSTQDVAVLARGVDWCYNWHFKAADHLQKADSPLAYYPMVWGPHEGQLKGLAKALEAGFRPTHVLAINEPNLKGQAFITPKKNAEWHREIETLAKKYNAKVIGPHMALGSAPKDSIAAMDPLQKKKVTYTFMVPYLNAFYHFVGGLKGIEAVAVHSYGNIHELSWMISELAKTYNKPIWVTEFAWWGAKNEKEQINYMIQAVDLFERTPRVEKYAWFKLRMGKGNRMSLMEENRAVLTPLGKAYLDMPTHDPTYFAPIPGVIEAENYTRMRGARMAQTKDTKGFLEMGVVATGAGDEAWLEYNLNVAQAGIYTLNCRAKGGGTVALHNGKVQLASIRTTDEFGDAMAKIQLAAGKQTLRLVVVKGVSKINSFRISQ